MDLLENHDPTIMNGIYIERLEHAVRVMQGLSESERANFDIDVFAALHKGGICACIAGFCGFDPWFQAHGFKTFISDDLFRSRGHLSIPIETFFGTHEPFFRASYAPELRCGRISVDDAVAALKKAIASFKNVSRMDRPPVCAPAAA